MITLQYKSLRSEVANLPPSSGTKGLSDSFQDNLLAPPVYTRPSNFQNMIVPEILLSGDQKKIEEWREKKAIERTKNLRPDIFD